MRKVDSKSVHPGPWPPRERGPSVNGTQGQGVRATVSTSRPTFAHTPAAVQGHPPRVSHDPSGMRPRNGSTLSQLKSFGRVAKNVYRDRRPMGMVISENLRTIRRFDRYSDAEIHQIGQKAEMLWTSSKLVLKGIFRRHEKAAVRPSPAQTQATSVTAQPNPIAPTAPPLARPPVALPAASAFVPPAPPQSQSGFVAPPSQMQQPPFAGTATAAPSGRYDIWKQEWLADHPMPVDLPPLPLPPAPSVQATAQGDTGPQTAPPKPSVVTSPQPARRSDSFDSGLGESVPSTPAPKTDEPRHDGRDADPQTLQALAGLPGHIDNWEDSTPWSSTTSSSQAEDRRDSGVFMEDDLPARKESAPLSPASSISSVEASAIDTPSKNPETAAAGLKLGPDWKRHTLNSFQPRYQKLSLRDIEEFLTNASHMPAMTAWEHRAQVLMFLYPSLRDDEACIRRTGRDLAGVEVSEDDLLSGFYERSRYAQAEAADPEIVRVKNLPEPSIDQLLSDHVNDKSATELEKNSRIIELIANPRNQGKTLGDLAAELSDDPDPELALEPSDLKDFIEKSMIPAGN